MSNKSNIIIKLQQDILQWEGYKPPVSGKRNLVGLGPVEDAFPNGVFPAGAVHEVVCASTEQAAAAGGVVTGILSALVQQGGVCVWISRSRRLFAPAFTGFGVQPHQIIFISLHKDKEALWVMEEALKCTGLTAVVCELNEIDFKQSRRLQLSVEHSRVTGFVLRNSAENLGSTACAARWQIRPLSSETPGGLPGVGFPRWQVDLLKVRNGKPGSWVLEWNQGRFNTVEEVFAEELFIEEERQVG